MRRAQDVLQHDPFNGEETTLVWSLSCPVCGENCVEQQGPDGEAGCVTVHPDRDEYDSPIQTRVGYTQVRLFCAAGHGFDLIVANHKGAQFIGVVSVGPRDYGWIDHTPR